jgi:hypothetical protein
MVEGQRLLAAEELLTVTKPVQGIYQTVIRHELELVKLRRHRIMIHCRFQLFLGSAGGGAPGGEKRVPSTPPVSGA